MNPFPPSSTFQKIVLATILLIAINSHQPPASYASTFIVNGTSDRADDDLGDGFCDTGVVLQVSTFPLIFQPECTLRAAVQEGEYNTPERHGELLTLSAARLRILPRSLLNRVFRR